jgi:hypothetical protein
VAETLVGLSGAFVDDLIRAGTIPFKEKSQETTENRCDIKPPVANDFTFAGFDIETKSDYLKLSQNDYIRRLKLVPSTCNFESFPTVRAKLRWESHSRPDIAFVASRLAQVTSQSFGPEALHLSNKGIKHLKANPELALRYPKLGNQLSDSLHTPMHLSTITVISLHNLVT